MYELYEIHMNSKGMKPEKKQEKCTLKQLVSQYIRPAPSLPTKQITETIQTNNINSSVCVKAGVEQRAVW